MSGIDAAFFGTLGRDAKAKTPEASKAYLRLSVRISEGHEAQWVSVLSFDQEAIAAADKLIKGATRLCRGLAQPGQVEGAGWHRAAVALIHGATNASCRRSEGTGRASRRHPA